MILAASSGNSNSSENGNSTGSATGNNNINSQVSSGNNPVLATGENTGNPEAGASNSNNTGDVSNTIDLQANSGNDTEQNAEGNTQGPDNSENDLTDSQGNNNEENVGTTNDDRNNTGANADGSDNDTENSEDNTTTETADSGNESNENTNAFDKNENANNEEVTEETNESENNERNDLPEEEEYVEEPPQEQPDTTGNTVIEGKPAQTHNPWMLSLTSGINQTRSSYFSESAIEQMLYENSVSDRIGIQSNLDVTYRLRNGLMFGTGIGYSRFDDSYSFNTQSFNIDSTENLEVVYDYEYEYDYYLSADVDSVVDIDSVFYISDSTAFVVDSITSYDLDSTLVNTPYSGVNRASYLSLPVHLGAQLEWKKFQFDLYASLRFNFLMNSSGGYLNNGEFIAFNSANSIYRRFYFDWTLGSKVHYNVYKNLYLTGTVQFRPVVGNALTGVSFNKTFHYTHFGLGVSLKL